MNFSVVQFGNFEIEKQKKLGNWFIEKKFHVYFNVFALIIIVLDRQLSSSRGCKSHDLLQKYQSLE